MRALIWKGINELGVETVKDPAILNPHGYVPSIHEGDIIGHEFMGEVVETGPQVQGLQRGDRVVAGSVIK